jgi:hypothetical protein
MESLTNRWLRGFLLLSLGGLAACSRTVITPAIPMTPTPAVLQVATSEIPTLAPATRTPVSRPTTPAPPTDTVAPPTATLTPTLATPAPITPAAGQQLVRVMLIAVNDNGRAGKKIGCGDSVVPVSISVPRTAAVLKASLQALLAIRQQNYGESGLYNALYASNLKVQSLTLAGGKATLYLTGTLKLGGECDNPRVQAQLEQTVLQFSTVKQVAVYINGQPLAQALSLK